MAAGSGQLKSGFMSFLPRAAMPLPAAFLHDGSERLFPLSWLSESKQIKRSFFKPTLLFNVIYGREEWGNTHTYIFHSLTADFLNDCVFD